MTVISYAFGMCSAALNRLTSGFGVRFGSSQRVSRGLFSFFGPQTSTTLVSQPINGNPGVLAFRERTLVGLLSFKTRSGLIYDIHAIGDPSKLAYVAAHLATR